jgi:hypothetical protein
MERRPPSVIDGLIESSFAPGPVLELTALPVWLGLRTAAQIGYLEYIQVDDRNSPPHASGPQPQSSGGLAWLEPLLLRFFYGTLVPTVVSSWGVLRSTGLLDRSPVARTVRRGDRRRVQPIRSGWCPFRLQSHPPPVARTRWASALAECQIISRAMSSAAL